MRKSEAYQALAVFMLSNKIEHSKASEWLMHNQPQTLCKIYDIYEEEKKKIPVRVPVEDPVYIREIKNALKYNHYVTAIKIFRTHTGAGLVDAKKVIDYSIGNTHWLDLSNEQQNLYDAYIAGFGIG